MNDVTQRRRGRDTALRCQCGFGPCSAQTRVWLQHVPNVARPLVVSASPIVVGGFPLLIIVAQLDNGHFVRSIADGAEHETVGAVEALTTEFVSAIEHDEACTFGTPTTGRVVGHVVATPRYGREIVKDQTRGVDLGENFQGVSSILGSKRESGVDSSHANGQRGDDGETSDGMVVLNDKLVGGA